MRMRNIVRWTLALAAVILLAAALESPAPPEPGCPDCRRKSIVLSPKIMKLIFGL
ncbi:MAG: hypothetical protein KA248_13010 [Kiritimatiellae bacterium]|nr:hypothetical protein [Kiritimatiellia bacterium]